MIDGPPLTEAPLGHVLSVRGSEAHVGMPAGRPPGERRATVGGFLTIDAGANQLVAMITEVSAEPTELKSPRNDRAIARVDLVGEVVKSPDGTLKFKRGVSTYPAIGDTARMIGDESLRLIFGPKEVQTVVVGHLGHHSSVPVHVDVNNLLAKHFAVLGSTGVGKSSGLAVILNKVLAADPRLRVLLLDGHNEYSRSFGDGANVVGADNLKLPFWLFSFEEFTDVVYGGRQAVSEEVEILAELIPLAKGMYQQGRAAGERLATVKRRDSRAGAASVDTPLPYLLQDLLNLIDDRMGKLENRSSRMTHHRLMTRIDTIRNDPRYGFMFSNANVGGDTMAALLSQLFRLDPQGPQVTVLQLATFPAEVTDAVVCILSRLAFDFGMWSDGAVPILLVFEEAHRYAAADRSIGFAPTRRAIARVAKEGRKYGIYLGLVSQRPAELDPTILSQCSTLFAMRMTNDLDQSLLRSAVSDAAANLLAFVPSLGTGEVIGFGEGMPLPTRLTFESLPEGLVPRSEIARLCGRPDPGSMTDFVRSVVDRWRGTGTTHSAPGTAEQWGHDADVAATGSATSQPEGATAWTRTSPELDQLRLQILRR